MSEKYNKEQVITRRKLRSGWYLELHFSEEWTEDWCLVKGQVQTSINAQTALAIILNEKGNGPSYE